MKTAGYMLLSGMAGVVLSLVLAPALGIEVPHAAVWTGFVGAMTYLAATLDNVRKGKKL